MEQETMGGDEEWREWDPSKSLRKFSANEVRFSSGFLALDFEHYFPQLRSHWLPLFHSLGTNVQLLSVQKTFEFPSNLRKQYVIEIDGELGVLGIDSRADRAFAGAIAPQSDALATQVLLEYLERRFLASLTKSWSGPEKVTCLHVNEGDPRRVSVAAAVQLNLSVDGVVSELWIGVGAKTLERIDRLSRASKKHEETPLDTVQDLYAIELAELLVPPELLIDYLRPQTVIGLDLPVRADVIIRKNDRPWALGRLGQNEGQFVVEIIDFDPESAPDSGGNTKLRVEVCRVQTDAVRSAELAHRGALLLTEKEVSPEVGLVIGSEQVGTALVGAIGGQFALSVLSSSEQ